MPEEMKTMATLAVSAERWCVPLSASDGNAVVQAEVETPEGNRSLDSSTIAVESFETGSEKSFKDDQEMDAFSKTYYRQPNPARLLPVLQFIVANQTKQTRRGQVEILTAFVTAALKSEPRAGEEFRKRIGAEPSLTRAPGLMVLRSAGYDIGSVLSVLSEEEQRKFLSLPQLQDPFDLAPTRDLFQHLDMMWAVYMATGDFKAVQTIAGTLSWRADYEAFDKLRNTPNHPSTLTPSIVRGVTYTAAGWSLWSFQRNDPLVADYIEYLLASPDTSDSIKTELRGLSSNPAFKAPGGRSTPASVK